MSKRNNNDVIIDIIVKIVGPLLITAVGLFAGLLLKKTTSTPKDKTETLKQTKKTFKTGHDWGMPPSNFDKNEKSEGSIITKAQFLLFGMFFRLCEIGCIVGDAGICKTLLACFIVKHSPFNKVVYFDLDDGNNRGRFNKIPSINPVYLLEFSENLDRIGKIAADKCGQRAYFDKVYTFPAAVEDRKKRLMAEMGVNDTAKIDKLFLFDIYLEEAIENGAEMVVLDSLNALLDTWQITREYLGNIFERCREREITFLILHHTNKKGEVAGSNHLSQIVDSLLLIKKLHGNFRKISLKKNRRLHEKEECFFKIISDGPDSASFEVCEEPEMQSSSDNLSPLEKKIINALGGNDTITLSELSAILGEINKNSVKNFLKRLEDKGFITKANGKTWRVIKSCRSHNNDC